MCALHVRIPGRHRRWVLGIYAATCSCGNTRSISSIFKPVKILRVKFSVILWLNPFYTIFLCFLGYKNQDCNNKRNWDKYDQETQLNSVSWSYLPQCNFFWSECEFRSFKLDRSLGFKGQWTPECATANLKAASLAFSSLRSYSMQDQPWARGVIQAGHTLRSRMTLDLSNRDRKGFRTHDLHSSSFFT